MSQVFRFLGQQEDLLWRVASDEFHHLKSVLRLGVGEEVEVTDGRGVWIKGRVCEVRKSEAFVEERSREVFEPEPTRTRVVLAALKHSDMDDVIYGLSEIGVDALSVFRPCGGEKSRMGEKLFSRWQRQAQLALKQCRRSFPIEVETFTSLGGAIEALPAEGVWYVGDELLGGSADTVAAASSGVIFVAAESGWAKEDRALLDHRDVTPVSLGPHIMRARTAAICAGFWLRSSTCVETAPSLGNNKADN